jgi:hypothetical protein
VYYTTNLGKIMSTKRYDWSGLAGASSLLNNNSNQDSLQGMLYQAPSTNMFKGTDLGNFTDTDFTATTGSAAIDNFTPVDIPAGEEGFFDNILSDKYKAGNIAGLASSLAQLAALPAMLKQAKLQNKSLQFNLDTAKNEQAKRNKNIAGFNAFRG